jgi:hypothetical protein
VSKLKEEIRALKEDDKLKEEQIQGFVRRIQELCGDMHDRYNQVVITYSLTHSLTHSMVQGII